MPRKSSRDGRPRGRVPSGRGAAAAADRLRDPARGLRRIAELADRHEQRLRSATDADLGALADGMRARLRRDGFAPELVGECFALVRESPRRAAIGKRHYGSQLLAGWALLQGRLVEMETGEGKTFAATLPACTAALAGYPVHVVTVNDYLADRDATEMGPLYPLPWPECRRRRAGK